MAESRLNYFTHFVDGATYGAWYRIVSSNELEVIGVGMLEAGEYNFSPDVTAKSILENFVRLRQRMGAPVPSLATLERQQDEDSAAASTTAVEPPQLQAPQRPTPPI